MTYHDVIVGADPGAGVRIARDVLRTPAWATVVNGELWPGDDVQAADDVEAFVRRRAETLYHPVGTCRMGTDPSASVMPTIVRGNTNAPTIMIAERAAELIAAP